MRYMAYSRYAVAKCGHNSSSRHAQ